MIAQRAERKYALCLQNEECDDLEVRKVYVVLPDAEAEREGYLRVVDESGDDYLYPHSYFVFVRLPRLTQRRVAAVA